MPRGRGAPRRPIALRLSADELAELDRAYKRESTRRDRRGHYGFRTWLRRTLLAHARQLELELKVSRTTQVPRNTHVDAGVGARNPHPAGGVSRERS